MKLILVEENLSLLCVSNMLKVGPAWILHFANQKIKSILGTSYECEMKQNVLRFGRKFFMYLDATVRPGLQWN